MDEDLCYWKRILDKRLKEEPDLEEMILNIDSDKTIVEMGEERLKPCYFCEGYNYNCPAYESYKTFNR